MSRFRGNESSMQSRRTRRMVSLPVTVSDCFQGSCSCLFSLLWPMVAEMVFLTRNTHWKDQHSPRDAKYLQIYAFGRHRSDCPVHFCFLFTTRGLCSPVKTKVQYDFWSYLDVLQGLRVILSRYTHLWEFPSGLVVRTRHFHSCGPGSILGWGTKIP